MPTIALAVGPFAETARFIRTSMVDTLSSDYIELGKAKGLSRMEVIRKHASVLNDSACYFNWALCSCLNDWFNGY